MPQSRPSKIHLQMIEVIKRFPHGIAGGQIRQELGLPPEEQTHLDRRKRDLKKWFDIEKIEFGKDGKRLPTPLYRYVRDRPVVHDEGNVSGRIRAAVLQAAHGRCRMCGKIVDEDGIKLVVDHKKPRDWGGTNDRDNLQALCEQCNAGKKAYFKSMDTELMKKATVHDSVHMRIGELLKAVGVGKRTRPDLLEVVADQEDWHKRLRELRYDVIGWEIDPLAYMEGGKKKVDYVLRSWQPWPSDPTGAIRRFEKNREVMNKRRKTSDPGSS
jgi:hypothetical protein